MNSSFVLGQAPQMGASKLQEVREAARSEPDEALKLLESIDLSLYPKKQAAEVYWMLSDCYLQQKKYLRAQILRQKAVDLDSELQAIVSSVEIFKVVDKVVKYGIDI
jgi:tetratricopeptide (TPR) repeat protein